MPRRRQFVVCSGLFLLVASSTLSQWQRILISGKGERMDAPFTHPLGYFTANPYLRDDGGDLCCGPDGLAASEQKYSISAEVQRLGTVAGFPIVQILYRVGPRGESEPAKVRWKFLLVQTGKDLYREIYHLQAYYIVPALKSAEIIKVGDEEILATNDGDGGNGGGCFEGYWWFDSAGPHQLDFSHVRAAILKHIPSSATFSTTCSALHLHEEEITSYVQAANPGWVTASFQLQGAVAVPTSVTYKPDAP